MSTECEWTGFFINYIRRGGQAVKTPPFHGGNTSSILVRVILKTLLFEEFFLFPADSGIPVVSVEKSLAVYYTFLNYIRKEKQKI